MSTRALYESFPATDSHRDTLICVVLFGAATTAHAQVSTGGMRGTVKDESGGVLVGVTVEATSPARIGGAAVEVSNDQGALPAWRTCRWATYTDHVHARRAFDAQARRDPRSRSVASLELPVTLAVGAMSQSITVTGSAPVVDTMHSGYTSNFNQQLLENIPSSRTSWFDVVTAAPAVRSDPVNANSASFLLYGSSGDQNSYQNDGVEVAAPSGGTVWSFPNPDTIRGSAGARRRRVGGVLRLPGRRREHHHQVGQQPAQGRRQLFLYRRRAHREQHAGRAISLPHRLPERLRRSRSAVRSRRTSSG